MSIGIDSAPIAVMAASFNSGLYQTMLIVHLVGAVVGFGGSVIGSAILRRSRAEPVGTEHRDAPRDDAAGPDAQQVAVADSLRRCQELASWWLIDAAVYTAGAAGVVAVLIDDRWDFRQAWVTIAFVLYFAWVAIAHGALRPTITKLTAAAEAAADEVTLNEAAADEADAGAGPNSGRARDLARLRRQAEWWYALSNLVIVAAIAVMVTKPGL